MMDRTRDFIRWLDTAPTRSRSLYRDGLIGRLKDCAAEGKLVAADRERFITMALALSTSATTLAARDRMRRVASGVWHEFEHRPRRGQS